MIELPRELPPTPPPGALELAASLSIATRIEPELIRAVRLGLHPHLDVGAESDLWFCHWVSARTHEAIALIPQCLPYLRARLARSLETDPRMGGVFEIISEYHQGLSPALVLEEQITWHTLIGEPEIADQHLHRALHALVRQNRTGVAGWFADAWQRIPAQARTTTAAWSLANATRSHVPALDPGQGPEVTLTDVATIAAAVGETRLGVRRAGTDLLLGQVQGPDALAILVPDTHPRLVEVITSGPLRTVRVEEGATVRVPVGKGPVHLRTGAGQIYPTSVQPLLPPPLPAQREWEVLLSLLSQGARPSLVPRLIAELNALLRKFHREDADTALKEAAQLCERALGAGYTPEAEPQLCLAFAEVLQLQGAVFGIRESLDRALTIGRAVHRDATGPFHIRALLTLGRAHRDLFTYSGETAELQESERLLSTALNLELGQEADPTEPLAEELRTVMLHYEVDPQPRLLSRAEHLASLVGEWNGRPPPTTLLDLSKFRLAQYAVTTDPTELDQAEAMAWELTEASGVPTTVRAEGLAVRATVALVRAHQGDQRALDSALRDLRAAIALVPAGRAQLLPLRLEYGRALRLRFRLLGRERDLTAAGVQFRAVVKGGPRPSLWAGLIGLSRCQLDDFHRTGESAALDRATNTAREAVSAATRTPSQQRSTSLVQLAAALTARYRLTNDTRDLDQAIDTLESAVRASDPRHPVPEHTVCALASALMDLHTHTADAAHLARAYGALDQFLARPLPGGPVPPSQALMLRAAVLVRLPDAEASSLRSAMSDAQRLAQMPWANPLLRLKAALVWSELGLRLNASDAIIDGYVAVAAGIPTALLLRGRIQATTMQSWEALGREAAAYLIGSGDAETALEMLEYQNILLSFWSRDSPAQLDQLTSTVSNLVEEVRWLWSLSNLAAPTAELTGWEASTDTSELNARMDRLALSMRTTPGLEGLFARPTARDLLRAASEGPIVVLNAAAHRCDALILTQREVSVSPLVRLDLISLKEMADEYSADRGTLSERSTGPDARSLLQWLWHRVVRQILNDLDPSISYRSSGTRTALAVGPPGPYERLNRVWWYPTGPFAKLPLHAAGDYDSRLPQNAMDYGVHSYTPTIDALVKARIRDRQTTFALEPRMLLVLGDPDLLHATREVEELHRRLPDSTLLRGNNATLEHVLASLPHHSFFHYSGHASHEGDPAGLHLHDQRLTPRHIPTGLVPDGALAYFSACDTNITPRGSEHPPWTIAAAFQSAGYRHVIAGLGQVSDRAASEVALAVYHSLLSPDNTLHPQHTARALHHALQQLPTDRPDYLLTRASLVHLGP